MSEAPKAWLTRSGRYVISQVTRHYAALPEEIRTDLPLEQIWVAVEEQP